MQSKVTVRPFKKEDFPFVFVLLFENSVEPPRDAEELQGPCFVAEKDGEIIGVVWALVGESTKAYIDFLAVSKEHRNSRAFFLLIQTLDKELKRRGVKRYMFHTEKFNTWMVDKIHKHHKEMKIYALNDLSYFCRELI